MRMRFVLTAAACLSAVGSVAQAQYGQATPPSLLAVPDAAPPPGRYPMTSEAPMISPAAQYYPTPYRVVQDANQELPAPVAPPENAWTEPLPEESSNSGTCNPYQEALSCDCADGCAAAAMCCRWYGSLAGLIMTRDGANKMWTTFDVTDPNRQLLFPPDADWRGGGEIRIGRRFGCDCGWALEGTYWGLDNLEGFSSVRSTADNLNTVFDVGNVNFGATPVANIFDNAREHRLTRTNEIHNIELNLLRQPWFYDASHGVQLAWLMGVRYLRFDEHLVFGSVAGGFEFGTTGGVEEGYLNLRTENDLVGFQVGSRIDWLLGQRLRLFARPTMGVFGNDINNRAQLTRGDGVVAFDYISSKEDVSLLGQLDLGLGIQVTPRWSVFGLYRAVGVTGIALSDSQVPPFWADAPGFRDIDSNGSLILHGAVIGAQLYY